MMFGKHTRGPFGHSTHREFNRRFDDHIADANTVERPWMANGTLVDLPPIANDFQRNRDPFIAKQMEDHGKSEAQRRGEQANGSSKMVEKDRPRLNLRPPPQMARVADERAFCTAWLKEQRAAAMAQANTFERRQPEAERGRELLTNDRKLSR